MFYGPCGRDHGRYISEDSRKVERATPERCTAEQNNEGPGPWIVKDEEGRIVNTYPESEWVLSSIWMVVISSMALSVGVVQGRKRREKQRKECRQ
jgi:hypothetical protein